MLYVVHIIHNYEKRNYMFRVVKYVILICSFAVASVFTVSRFRVLLSSVNKITVTNMHFYAG